MAKRGCAAPSAGKPWTITSMETVWINSKCSERTAKPSSRRYAGNTSPATPKWMALFSFARTICLREHRRQEKDNAETLEFAEERREEYVEGVHPPLHA